MKAHVLVVLEIMTGKTFGHYFNQIVIFPSFYDIIITI
jgi:hypothetical protein